MKKTVPFELFRPGEEIYFNIVRLAELEKKINKPIVEIVGTSYIGIDFCLAGIEVGLKQHYPRTTKEQFAEMMGKYLEEGGTLDEIAVPIIKAIMASGIFGQQKEEQQEAKNVGKATAKSSKA